MSDGGDWLPRDSTPFTKEGRDGEIVIADPWFRFLSELSRRMGGIKGGDLSGAGDEALILANTAITTSNTAVTTAANAALAAATANALAVTAQTAAANALADATLANAKIAEIASDGVISPIEKGELILRYAVLIAEQAGINAKADFYGIATEKTAFNAAITALTVYLGTLTSPVPWDNFSGNTNVNGVVLRAKFSDAYSARQVLLNKIYEIALQAADAAQLAADLAAAAAATATLIANNAQTAANAAQQSANAANADIALIVSDNVLVPSEKPRIIEKHSVIIGEQAGINALADQYSIVAQKTTYNAAITSLVNYLSTLTTPTLWNSLSGNTNINGAFLATKFADVYLARQAVLNIVAANSGTPGANGYVHIKYSNDGGITFTANNGEEPGDWLGQYTDNIAQDSNAPTNYIWKRIKGVDGADAVTAKLNLASYALPADSAGVVSSYAGAVTTMTVNKGGINDTVNWAFSKADSAGVTSTLAGATVTITTMTVDTGHVDITATRAGFSAQTLRFGLSKIKFGIVAGVVIPAPVLFSSALAASIVFNSNGSIDTNQDGAGGYDFNSSQWYAPVVSGAGSGYYIKAIKISGANNGALSNAGVWRSLDVSRAFSILGTATGGIHCSYEISTGAGASIKSTGTFTLYNEPL
jgi:hypothetical protein